MSSRRNANRIRGPNSALTDFLAANNISAQQIRDTFERRRRAAEQEAAQDGTTAEVEATVATTTVVEEEEEEVEIEEEVEVTVSKKRKRKETKPVKGKDLKKHKGKGKKGKKGSDDEDDDDYDEELVRDMYKKAKPLPGQLENCEICEKRFTVTPYNKEGPDGGLLCTQCGKKMAADIKIEAKPKKATGRKRRKVESDRLDGVISTTKTLQQLCIEKVAQHSEDIEGFGDMPPQMVDKLSMIFSKRRVLKGGATGTLPLFLRPDLDEIALYDAAYLETEDYNQIFAISPNVEKVVINNACQFKDVNMEYMIEKAKHVKHFHLYAANLVSNDMWTKFIKEMGPNLETLQLQWLDASFEDEHVELIAQHCTKLRRLKLELCRRIGVDSVDSISRMTTLEHLSLQISHDVPSTNLVTLIEKVGGGLRTLSLSRFLDADDSVLEAIHNTCTRLNKLRISENDLCTDAGYTALFTNWANPALTYVDFNSTRDVDNSNHAGPEEPNGVASNGFKAFFKHSGKKLEYVNLASCRHIEHEAWAEVFSGAQYPALKEMDLSFCNTVDTSIVAGIFKSCPAMRKLTAFGCFKVEDVVVPRGIVLIGVPRAQEAIEQFGEGSMGLMDMKAPVRGMVGVGA